MVSGEGAKAEERRAGASAPRPPEVLAVLGAFLAFTLLAAALQEPVSHNEGKGWDGVFYVDIARQFAEGRLPRAGAPFVHRLGVPFLASLAFPDRPLAGFLAVNLAANFLVALLLPFWLAAWVRSPRVRFLLSLLYFSPWFGPVRFVHYAPAFTDPCAHAAMLAGLLALRAARSRPGLPSVLALALVLLPGVLVRDFVALVAVAFVFANGTLRRLPRGFWIPLVAAGAAVALARLVGTPTNRHSVLREAIRWAYEKPFLTYVHGWFVAYGPVLAILLHRWKDAARFLREEPSLALLLGAFAVLGWIGYSDTERILFFAAPVLLVLLGRAIEASPWLAASPLLVAVLVAAQALSDRIFWPVPDYPNPYPHRIPLLAPLGTEVPLFDLYSFHGESLRVKAIALAEHAFLALLLLVAFRRGARRAGKETF